MRAAGQLDRSVGAGGLRGDMNGREGAPLQAVHAVPARLKHILVDVSGRQQISNAGVDCCVPRRYEVAIARKLRRLLRDTPQVSVVASWVKHKLLHRNKGQPL